MANVNVDLVGFESLTQRITELGAKSGAVTNPALRAGAEPIRDDMVDRASVRTGRGRDSVKIGKISTLKGGKAISIGIHKEDHKTGLHMYYQEFGTSRHVARPFIRPAFESKKQEAYELIKEELRRGLGL